MSTGALTEADEIDAILEQAADALGDLTPHVMARYLACHPEAAAWFNAHGLGEPQRLAGRMVESVVYFLMEWRRSRAAVQIALLDTFPHHVRTLGITPEAFRGLLQAVCEVVRHTLPEQAHRQRTAWSRLEQEVMMLLV